MSDISTDDVIVITFNGDHLITATGDVNRYISGNGGDDVITVASGITFVNGRNGDDTLTGGVFADYLAGVRQHRDLVRR